MPSLDHLNFSLPQLQKVLGSARHPKLTDDRYDKAHERFEGASSQQNLILKWLTDFSANFPRQDSLKILSVGCGSGILDNPLLSALAKSEKPVNYTGIDPNSVACGRFRDAFELLQLANVQLEVREETVESISCDERFDIIHAVHSLYYFDDPAAAIEQLLARLNKTGKLVIFQAPKAELNQLADCFWFHDQDVDIWFSERLQKHLHELGCVSTMTRIDGQVDVASCFDPSSPEGSLILDFVTQIDCNLLQPAAREQLLGFLKTIAEFSGDQILVPHPVDVFEITPANK